MIIAKFGAKHVRAVAALHASHLTGLLRALGAPAARAFYAGCAESARTYGFVALDGDRVCGFVIGSLTPRALKLEAIARKPLAFTLGATLGMIRRPAAIPFVWDMLRGSAGSYDAGAPELTYIAVAPEHQRGSVGKQLVDAFTETMRAAGVRSYELSVEEDNKAADAFYRRLGFANIGRYREFGVYHRRYTLDLTTPKPATGD